MRNFERTKREILDRVSLVEVVSQYVRLRQRGGRYVGLCPFHNEKTPSFTVNGDEGFFKCFGCGRGGDLFTFVMLMDNVPFMDALRMLADRAGVTLAAAASPAPAGPGRADIVRVNEWACGYFRRRLMDRAAGAEVRKYVASRGIREATSEQFELGLAEGSADALLEAGRRAGFDAALLLAADLVRESDHGSGVYPTFRNRLMFPIRDVMNRVVGFGGRALGDDRSKYLNTRQTALYDKGRTLYGMPHARRAIVEKNRVIVVEGYMDVLMAHQAGFPESVASLGTALTESHAEMLRRYAGRVILLFDGDEAGQRAADRAIEVALPRQLHVGLAAVPGAKDPADFLQDHASEAFEDVLRSSIDALEFKWSKLQGAFGAGGDDRGRHQAVGAFIDLVAKTCQAQAIDPIARGLVVNRVASLLTLTGEEVNRLLVQALRRLRSPRGDVREEASRNVQPAAATVPADGVQAALGQILEVLLNEPGLYADVQATITVEEFADPRDRRIMGLIRDLVLAGETFRLADVLAGCDDPGDAQRAIDLAERGRGFPDPRHTLSVALDRLVTARKAKTLGNVRGAVIDGLVSDETDADRAAALGNYHRELRHYRHFAGRRQLRSGTGGAEPAAEPRRDDPTDPPAG